MRIARPLLVLVVVLATACFSKPEFRGMGGSFEDAPGPPPNFMFVSSEGFVSTGAQTIADADALCTRLGQTLSSGVYVAWLSAGGVEAAARLQSYNKSGWVRPDGLPFANTVTDIVDGKTFYPPRIDENKQDVVQGTTPLVLTAVPPNCAFATTTVGSPDANGGFMFDVGGNNCTLPQRLYCFEVERETTVTPAIDRSKRFAFLTSNLFTIKGPNITQGIDDLDGACQVDGANLDNTRQFLALAAPTSLTAQSRFTTTGEPWIRPDGVVVSTDLKSFTAPLDMIATKDRISGFAWFGAPNTDTPGSENCAEWSSLSGVAAQGATSRSNGFAMSVRMASCSSPAHVYCFEQ